mgnify:FL=1
MVGATFLSMVPQVGLLCFMVFRIYALVGRTCGVRNAPYIHQLPHVLRAVPSVPGAMCDDDTQLDGYTNLGYVTSPGMQGLASWCTATLVMT